MKNHSTLTVYAPLDHLPAEGYEAPPHSGESADAAALLAFYRGAMADCNLVCGLSAAGGIAPAGTADFGKFRIEFSAAEHSPVPTLIPVDGEFRIDLDAVLPEPTDNDALEPEDLVRQFLERLRPALPTAEKLRRTPLIRWESDPEIEGARVQLLGILELPEDEFDDFLATHSDFQPILEEAEVEAHGIRETVAALAIIGLTALSAPEAEAGLLRNLFSGRKDAPAKAIQVTEAAKPQPARQGWVDVHKDAKIDKKLLEAAAGGKTRIVVDVSRQRAFVLIDGRIAIDTPVSTARAGKYTPRGSYRITERVQTGKHSTIYGCEMPYWMRLDESAIGLHIGDLPGYPASAGCVRLPYSVAPVIFANTRSGTEVKIVDAWDLATNLWQAEDDAKMMVAAVDTAPVPQTP